MKKRVTQLSLWVITQEVDAIDGSIQVRVKFVRDIQIQPEIQAANRHHHNHSSEWFFIAQFSFAVLEIPH